jgi:hypothetical protein
MKKYTSILVAMAVFLSFAQVSFAGAPPPLTIGKSKSFNFYVHDKRPPEVLDGPSRFSRESFDMVFEGNDRLVGTTEFDIGAWVDSGSPAIDDGVYVDVKTGCYYKGNDSTRLFHLDLLDGGTDSFYGFTPFIQLADGQHELEVPFVYELPGAWSKCADIRTRTKSFNNKLKLTGSIKDTNSKVYEPKNPLNSAELKKLYRGAVFPEGERPTFAEYVTKHPLIYIYDNLGSYHRLLNTTFAPAAEMGKPALYLYPEKETNFTVKVLPVGGKITVEIPALNNLTWQATAKPNGELTVDGKSYPYLYYESTTTQPMPMTKGAVVAQKDVPTELAKMLDTLGFKPAEKTEFLAYWLPRMKSQAFYTIQFLINGEVDKYSKLTISPALPLYRVFMNFQGSSKPAKLPAQELKALDRKAPHAFEWGGNNLAK